MSVPLRALLIGIVLLAGCAQPVQRQAYNADEHQAVKRVVIAQLENQKTYEAVILGHPGMSYGLIGGLIAAADIQAKSNKLTAAVDAAQTKVRDHFSSLVRDGLTDQGYQVDVIVVPEDTLPDACASKAKERFNADAVLVTRVMASYWAAGPTTPYLPRIQAEVVALHLGTGATLYQDTFTYGYTDAGQKDTVHFPADAKYSFKDIDTLVANPALARDGWVEGLKLISSQVLNDVKRK